MRKDLYDILGLDRDSTQEEIKRAYRRLVFQYHPDRNPGDTDAENKLKEINEAYEVLSNPEKRARYDSLGQLSGEGLFSQEHFSSSFTSLFDDLFGEVFNVGRRRRPERGRDLRYDLEIDFNEAAFGAEKEISIPRRDPCEVCGGAGAPIAGQSLCGACNGTGAIRWAEGFFAINRTCSACNGKGFIITDPCQNCGGDGFKVHQHTVRVKIPAGVDDGMRLKIRGEGEAGVLSGPAGDLYIKIHVMEHPFFRRNGTDVHCEVPITFAEAVLGAEINIPTLEGRGTIDIPPGTQSGQTFRLESRGIPSIDRGFIYRGDLFVAVRVEVPKDITPEQREYLERFRERETDEVNPMTKDYRERIARYFGD